MGRLFVGSLASRHFTINGFYIYISTYFDICTVYLTILFQVLQNLALKRT